MSVRNPHESQGFASDGGCASYATRRKYECVYGNERCRESITANRFMRFIPAPTFIRELARVKVATRRKTRET
jgi:hypothetical protein